MSPFFLSKGFSLVELIVVVSILSILSISTVVGFGAFGDVLKAKEVKGIIGDLIKESELLVLKGDYQKIDFHFFQDYLALVETPENTSLVLSLEGECVQDGMTGRNLRAGSAGVLHKKDESDRSLDIDTVGMNERRCVLFSSAEEQEWRYQIVQEDEQSPIVRFAHFNIDTSFSLVLNSTAYRLEIQAPYAKKQLYVNGLPTSSSVTLAVQKEGADTSETVSLQF